MKDYILEMNNITKEYPGVKALNNVNLKIERASIHALVGENGAGKSTLMNILSGTIAHNEYTGQILYNNNECKFQKIHDSEKLGIVIIHQELALIPELTIAENMFLGNERKNRFGIIDWNETFYRADQAMKAVGLNENTQSLIKDIGTGKQQLVEIAKAISKDVKLLILDEPTSSLNDEDSRMLLDMLIRFKNEERIIKGMVGRELEDRYPAREHVISDEIIFEARDWSVYHPIYTEKCVVNNISFNVKKGEVVGFSGLQGAGRTELAKSLFGKSYGSRISGQEFIAGKEVFLNSSRDAIVNGLAYVTEDRKTDGLILSETIARNTTLARMEKIADKRGVVDVSKENMVANDYVKAMKTKTPSVLQKVGNLSGGNQQKVLLSKWMFAGPEVLFLDEPTRGIDVGAKYEIYSIINDMVGQGKSVVMISSDLTELLGMCDRIYVMNEGKITGEFSAEEATQEKIMSTILKSDCAAVN